LTSFAQAVCPVSRVLKKEGKSLAEKNKLSGI
jgi:hypothetical protein